MTALVSQIIELAVSPKSNITSLLRMAKVAGVKLKQDKAVAWISAELEGYNCPAVDLPTYRKLYGELKMFNPYRGFIPVNFTDPESAELVTFAPVFQSLPSIEKDIEVRAAGGTLQYPLSSVRAAAIIKATKTNFQPSLHLSSGQVLGILERVRDLVLNWALELDQLGISGEGMSFTMEDEKKAASVTQHIIAQNVGFIAGNGATSNNSVVQTASGDQNIDQRKLESLISQAEKAIPLLPIDLQKSVSQEIAVIKNSESIEARRSGLSNLKTILEGAAGNLVAAGIIQLIVSII